MNKHRLKLQLGDLWQATNSSHIAGFGIKLANLLLLLLITYLVAELCWSIWSLNSSKPRPALAIASASESNHSSTTLASHARALQRLAVFGLTSKSLTAGAARSNSQDTHLSLLLNGVLPSNSETRAKALINHNGKLASYKIGDTLPGPGQVKLKLVFNDRVVLENNGSYETLWLNKKLRQLIQKHKVQPPVATTQQVNDPTTGFMIKNTRAGIKVYAGSNPDLFSALGLQEGDVIERIAGQAAGQQTHIASIYQQLLKQPSIDLAIRRQGRLITVSVSSAQLIR